MKDDTCDGIRARSRQVECRQDLRGSWTERPVVSFSDSNSQVGRFPVSFTRYKAVCSVRDRDQHPHAL